MIIAVGILCLLVGFFLGGLFHKKVHNDEVLKLNNELISTRTKSADELTTAYEKIESLSKDNRILVKQLKELKNNNV